MPDPTWTKISTTQTDGNIPFGWFFTHACVERNGQARIWFTWAGNTYLYTPRTNAWTRVLDAGAIGWRENFGTDHDTDNGLVWIGEGAADGQPVPPAGFQFIVHWNWSTHAYAAPARNFNSANCIMAFDPLRHKLYNFAGWQNRDLTVLTTSPLGTAWTYQSPTNPPNVTM